MGLVIMSEQELNRIEVLAQIEDGQLTVAAASNLLNLTQRQIYRLLKTFRIDGPSGLRHKARGKTSNNQFHVAKRAYALDLIRREYSDFGPTLAAEMLEERHDFKVSRETLRKWMQEDGIWLSRKQRRKFHQPRLRREYYGELIQIDGSPHRWFEDRGDPCTLLVFIDDATSRLMQLRFVKSESTFSYFEALDLYLQKHGRPVAFYSDKHTVFRVPKQDAKSGHGMTQFGRAINDLNIEILCANSPQAKGRVERANRTLQDRLIKELRLENISNMEDGNAYLDGYAERFNMKFAKNPAKSDNLHRAMNIEPDRLREVFCFQDQRYVGQQLTFSYERKRIMLEETDVSRGLVGKYVDTYQYPDGRLEIKWKGLALPYTVFSKDQQRITHAAITENKNLGAVLAYAKLIQEKEGSPKAKPAGKQRTRYKPTGKRPSGRKSFIDKRAKQMEESLNSNDLLAE